MEIIPLSRWESKPGKQASLIIVFLIFFVVGGIQGFGHTIIFYITSSGGSFSDQATFSLAYYAFDLKLLIAPFLDIVSS